MRVIGWMVVAAVCACSRQAPEVTNNEPAAEEPAPKAAKPKELRAIPPPGTPPMETAAPVAKAPSASTKTAAPKVVSLLDVPGAGWSPWKLPSLKDLGFPEGLPSTLPPLPAFTLPLPSATTATTSAKKGPAVILYGAEWCPHCTTAKQHLAKRSIAYVYRNVDEPEANKELGTKLSKAGQPKGGIPTTDIDGDLLVGWSEQQFDEMYDAKAKK